MTDLANFTDAIRWWGALAGLIGVADVWRWFTARTDAERFYGPALAATGRLSLCFFLLLAGVSIPMTVRLPGFTPTSPLFLEIMAVAWASISTSGWLFVVSRSRHHWLMAATAALAYAATLFAATMSAHV